MNSKWGTISRFSIFGFYLACLLLAANSAAPAQNTDIRSLQRTYRELRAFEVSDEVNVEDHEIPTRIRWLQTRFKHQVRALMANILNQDADSISRPPREIRLEIRNKLKRLGLITRPKKDLSFFSFGHVLNVSVSRLPEHPDILAVGLVVDGGWDRDQSLYIFQNQSSGWVDLLAAEVNGYGQVWDAQSARFNYAVSPSAPDGSWFLVTSSINPHMASAWQDVTYTALAPGRDADHPKVLVRRSHSIYLDTDDEGRSCRIRAMASTFRVSFRVGVLSESLSDERYSDEYQVVGGMAERIAVHCRTHNRFGKSTACDSQDVM